MRAISEVCCAIETRNEAVAYCKAHGYRANERTREQFNRQF